MPKDLDTEKSRVLHLLLIDAQRLFERIILRAPVYIEVFSAKRTREHFPDVFWNRYKEVSFSELKLCPEVIIHALDEFYQLVDELKWYLNNTQDMPATVEDHLLRSHSKLKKKYQYLDLVIKEELGLAISQTPHISLQSFPTPPVPDPDDPPDDN